MEPLLGSHINFRHNRRRPVEALLGTHHSKQKRAALDDNDF